MFTVRIMLKNHLQHCTWRILKETRELPNKYSGDIVGEPSYQDEIPQELGHSYEKAVGGVEIRFVVNLMRPSGI